MLSRFSRQLTFGAALCGLLGGCASNPPSDPEVLSATPNAVPYGYSERIVLTGRNFTRRVNIDLDTTARATLDGRFRVLVGEVESPRVDYLGTTSVSFVLPVLAPGSYDLELLTPQGTRVQAPEPLQVISLAGLPAATASVSPEPGPGSIPPGVVPSPPDGGEPPPVPTAGEGELPDGGQVVPCAPMFADCTLVLFATVADCIDLASPDPDACEQISTAGEFAIDGLYTLTNTALHGYLRFEVPSPPAGTSFTAVALELHTTSHNDATSPSTGEIWSVETFTRADLFDRVPTVIGSSPVGANLGRVALNQLVRWELPASLVAIPGPLTLGVFPTLENGTHFYGRRGRVPPRLVLNFR